MQKYKSIHKCIATSWDSFPFELSFPLQVLHAKMHVRPLIRSDIPAVAEITNQIFSKDKLFTWLYPHQDRFPDDLRRFQMIRLRTRLVERGSHGFVAESEEGDAEWTGKPEVLGFAFYIRNGNDAGAKKWRHDPPINSWWPWLQPLHLPLDFVADVRACRARAVFALLGNMVRGMLSGPRFRPVAHSDISECYRIQYLYEATLLLASRAAWCVALVPAPGDRRRACCIRAENGYWRKAPVNARSQRYGSFPIRQDGVPDRWRV